MSPAEDQRTGHRCRCPWNEKAPAPKCGGSGRYCELIASALASATLDATGDGTGDDADHSGSRLVIGAIRRAQLDQLLQLIDVRQGRRGSGKLMARTVCRGLSDVGDDGLHREDKPVGEPLLRPQVGSAAWIGDI